MGMILRLVPSKISNLRTIVWLWQVEYLDRGRPLQKSKKNSFGADSQPNQTQERGNWMSGQRRGDICGGRWNGDGVVA